MPPGELSWGCRKSGSPLLMQIERRRILRALKKSILGEDDYLKHRAWINLSPMTRIHTVQLRIVQLIAYFDQFPHWLILHDLYSDFKRKYYFLIAL